MTDPQQPPEEEVKDFTLDQLYLMLCLVSLILTVVGLEELENLALIPFVLGALALWFRWTSLPHVWLLIMAVLLSVQFSNGNARLFGGRNVMAVRVLNERGAGSPVTFLTCAAALVFTICYCRRQVLLDSRFPGDAGPAPPAGPDARHAGLTPARRDKSAGVMAELTPLLVTVPVCCLAGYFLWLLLVRVPQPPELPLSRFRDEWGLLVLCWFLATAGLVGSLVTGYLDRARASPAQNLLYLQDQLWRQTRREQGRLNRWLVAARLRGQRRKEKA